MDEKTIRRIHETVADYSRLAGIQKEIIDELYRLLLMYISAEDIEPLNRKILSAEEIMKEVEE